VKLTGSAGTTNISEAGSMEQSSAVVLVEVGVEF
jgi:hypothetical protein